jgi:hypothetical protein
MTNHLLGELLERFSSGYALCNVLRQALSQRHSPVPGFSQCTPMGVGPLELGTPPSVSCFRACATASNPADWSIVPAWAERIEGQAWKQCDGTWGIVGVVHERGAIQCESPLLRASTGANCQRTAWPSSDCLVPRRMRCKPQGLAPPAMDEHRRTHVNSNVV